MTDNDGDIGIEFQILMNMLLHRNDKNYLIIIASNKTRDFVVILIQQSSYIYRIKYNLEDFQKINFFKNYVNLGLGQCIEILINLLKEKKNVINILENESISLLLNLELEISVSGLNLNLPKERIDILLNYENLDQNIKTNLIWYTVLNIFKEKEKDKKILTEKEEKIAQLNEEIIKLKQIIEEKKLTYFFEENIIKNDLKKSRIIGDNLKNFDFIKRRLKLIFNDKKFNFKLLYNARINGDKSQKFHQFCDNHKNTLILIKTDTNNIFGGFAGKMWNSLELGRKKDYKSFLFSYNMQKIYNPKTDAKYHLYCSDKDGPCFYAFSVENLFLENGGECDEICKCSYESFESEYELNKGQKKFQIEELEVYEIAFI